MSSAEKMRSEENAAKWSSVALQRAERCGVMQSCITMLLCVFHFGPLGMRNSA
jgi:hypothetical protein